MVEIKFMRTRNVEAPRKAIETDAGIDFWVPVIDDRFINDFKALNQNWSIETEVDKDGIQIFSLGHCLIPLGIKSIIPTGWSVVFHNKSGIAAKKELIVGACVIDSEYRNEWLLDLHNIGSSAVTIESGQKIVQGLVQQVPDVKLIEISAEEFEQNANTNRKGGFGSTGV